MAFSSVVDETAFICVLSACHYYLHSNARGIITFRDLVDTLFGGMCTLFAFFL